MLDEGDISDTQYKRFFLAAKNFYYTSLLYIKEKFPLDDPVICNASWINVPDRLLAEWENVEFYFKKFQNIMKGIPEDQLFEEFCDVIAGKLRLNSLSLPRKPQKLTTIRNEEKVLIF